MACTGGSWLNCSSVIEGPRSCHFLGCVPEFDTSWADSEHRRVPTPAELAVWANVGLL